MIISTCGFGSTGSSAVSDYILECDDVQVFDNIEFTIASIPDGLSDLEYHLLKCHTRLSSSIYAIQRFRKLIASSSREWCFQTSITKKQINEITNNFLEEIIQLRFIGYSPAIDKKYNQFWRHYWGESIVLHRIIPALEKGKIIKKNFDFFPLEEVEVSINPLNFYKAAVNYTQNLLSAMGCDFSKKIVLDQAFSGDNPVSSFPFYKDPYAVVVDRDPRDLYIFAKKFLLSRGRFMPTDSVDNFITYYRMLRDNQPYKIKNIRVLVINFEDLVYDYDNTSSKINTFLGLRNNHRHTIFKPEISVANTNLIRKYPELKEDIKEIERRLPEYLFHFEKYKTIKDAGEMFFGKSPLNK